MLEGNMACFGSQVTPMSALTGCPTTLSLILLADGMEQRYHKGITRDSEKGTLSMLYHMNCTILAVVDLSKGYPYNAMSQQTCQNLPKTPSKVLSINCA